MRHCQAVLGQLQMCRSGRIPTTGYTVGVDELVVEGLSFCLFDNAGGCCATLLRLVLGVINISLDIRRENGDFFWC